MRRHSVLAAVAKHQWDAWVTGLLSCLSPREACSPPHPFQNASWLGGTPAGSLGPSLQLLRCLQQTRCAGWGTPSCLVRAAETHWLDGVPSVAVAAVHQGPDSLLMRGFTHARQRSWFTGGRQRIGS